MTTPAQPQQPPSQAASAAAVTALTAAVAVQLVNAVTVNAAVSVLYQAARAAGIPRRALFTSLQVVMTTPPGQTGAIGSATLVTERLNLLRRAQFVVSAAQRIGADLISAHSRGQSLSAVLGASVQRERRFYAQHLMAIWQRSHAGAQVDSTAMTYGNLLGWHAHEPRDGKTSPECLAADGKNFYADHMPLIGYPGAVHPHCRCQAGSPFPGARLVPSYGLPAARGYRRAA
jgi:hypothetical protein